MYKKVIIIIIIEKEGGGENLKNQNSFSYFLNKKKYENESFNKIK